MTRSLLISMAALTFACGGGSPADDAALGARSEPNAAVQGGSAADEASSQIPPGMATADDAEQTVTLIGCLAGPGAAGASGSEAAGSRSAALDRYTLVDATPESDASAGVGTSGAGAAGGPLVSGRSTFELSGLPESARGHVENQVRVTGLVQGRPVSVGGPAGQPAGGANSIGAATGTPAGAADATGAGTSGAGARHLTVPSVEGVAQTCAPQR